VVLPRCGPLCGGGTLGAVRLALDLTLGAVVGWVWGGARFESGPRTGRPAAGFETLRWDGCWSRNSGRARSGLKPNRGVWFYATKGLPALPTGLRPARII
jgi:hypothetical protein